MHAEVDAVLNSGRLPTLEDLPRLRYTEMVFAESMRLYPPAWAMGRQSIAGNPTANKSLSSESVPILRLFVTL